MNSNEFKIDLTTGQEKLAGAIKKKMSNNFTIKK